MAELGLESYRFSIAWPRVQPSGRGPGQRGRASGSTARLAEGLLERGIEPIATLYHWDLPQALQDARRLGRARHRAALRRVRRDRAPASWATSVSQWITHNEPWVVAFLGHAYGHQGAGHPPLAHRPARVAPPAALPRPGAAARCARSWASWRRSGSR